MKRRSPLAALWIVGGLLVLSFIVRSFVADVYRVESGSMEPTLYGGGTWGEWALVRYESMGDLERFDLAVTYTGSGTPIVKRVVGLPGETVQVQSGDLFVDGRRLPPEAPRPAPVVLFDGALHEAAEQFEWDDGTWTRAGDGWELDSRLEPDEDDAHLLRWRSAFDDGYLLPDGTRLAGTRPVGDGIVACELWLDDIAAAEGATVRLELREEGDLFRAAIELGTSTARAPDAAPRKISARARIERLSPEHLPETLALAELELASGTFTPLSFANVDNALVFAIGGTEPLVARYSENRVPAGPAVVPGVTVGTQVALGGDGLRARFKAIRIARDVSWIARGEFGVGRPLSLGPDEYFLLGDNSARSQDGRTLGPTQITAFLGRPQSIVWPRSRARSLLDDKWEPAGRRRTPLAH